MTHPAPPRPVPPDPATPSSASPAPDPVEAAAVDAAVSAQYQSLPYPERRPADEDKRLLVGSPSHWLEIDHYLFGGRRDWRRPFRALFAGGGTGDGSIMLAQQLADRGCPAELLHLEPSAASRAIAEARAARRGLGNLRFIAGTIEQLPALDLGQFDYIDCCGVLHHLADPPAALAVLAAALAPGGGMGLMVYGRHGRSGVYEMQALLRDLFGDQPPEQRLALGRRLVAEMPPTNLLARNPMVGDHRTGGAAGFTDLLLHPRDRAYDVWELAALVTGAGLRIAAFIEPARYDPASYLRHPDLLRRIAALDPVARAAAAELLTAAMPRHAVYLAPDNGQSAGRQPAGPAPDLTPCWRGGPEAGAVVARALGTRGVLELGEDPLVLRLVLPPQAGMVAGLIDGHRSWEALAALVAERLKKPIGPAETLLSQCCLPLVAANQLLFTQGSPQ